jgi:protein-S-isoprenylcysteine O-methyltransferase Ste14
MASTTTSTTTRRENGRGRHGMRAVLSTAYGAGCYLASLAVTVYAVAFLADVLVPMTVDHGGDRSGTAVAVVVDVALLLVFALQHSVMARPALKRRWTRVVPSHLERSTYVLLTSAALALIFWQWRPLPAVVWDVPGALRPPVWLLYAVGWAWVVAMTFAIDHLDLFGLGRVARHVRGLADEPVSFVLPLPYRLVRHPMMLGFIVAFLAAPTMTAGHLLFAGLGCAYIVAGVRLEEQDLARELPEYRDYAATTPRLLPLRRRPRSDATAPAADPDPERGTA